MREAGLDPRGSVLQRGFNARYLGRPVTYQGVQRWLRGLSIPAQDKLTVLAEWLNLSPHYLRFGEHTLPHRPRLGIEAGSSRPFPITDEERKLLLTVRDLPSASRELLHKIAKTLVADALARGEKIDM